MGKYNKRGAGKSRITVRAYAKVNLSLDVLRRRPDGYHEVDMVMQAVELYDKVILSCMPCKEGAAGKISVTTNLAYLPVNGDNIAYKAARLMEETYGHSHPPMEIGIHLEKHIPVAAGLAGGSANGAAVLRGLGKLWGLNLSLAALCQLGEQLGADVPFCLWAQEGLTCARATGLGTVLSPLPPLRCFVLLSKPPISVSTAKVYGKLSLEDAAAMDHPDTEALVRGLKKAAMMHGEPQVAEKWEAEASLRNAGLLEVAEHMKNLLETVTLVERHQVLETKERMQEAGGALAVMMSGSGPTVFGLYEDEAAAKQAYQRMRKVNRETYLRRTFLG